MKKHRFTYFLWVVFLLALLAAGIWLVIEGGIRFERSPFTTWDGGSAVAGALRPFIG